MYDLTALYRAYPSHTPLVASELEIHWLSIMNSFVLVILLTGFIVVIVMRVLKSDYTRYSRTDEEDGTAPSAART